MEVTSKIVANVESAYENISAVANSKKFIINLTFYPNRKVRSDTYFQTNRTGAAFPYIEMPKKAQQRRNSEGRMTRSKAAAAASAASAASAVTAGSIRLRSGSAGHKQLDDEDEDEEHQAIQVFLLPSWASSLSKYFCSCFCL